MSEYDVKLSGRFIEKYWDFKQVGEIVQASSVTEALLKAKGILYERLIRCTPCLEQLIIGQNPYIEFDDTTSSVNVIKEDNNGSNNPS